MCVIAECDRPVVARGWCSKHYQRWKATGDPLATKPWNGPRGRARGFQHSAETLAKMSASRVRHGFSRTPTHNTWTHMWQRVTDPNCTQWRWYGGRGIAVCDRWKVFENFLADMGERPAGKTLDRIDPNGNYEPSNCRWATPTEQARNRRKG